jgi:hypothetical protein
MIAKLKFFQLFELWFLDLGIRLLSQSGMIQFFWKGTYDALNRQQLLWYSLLIMASSFMGLISSYVVYALVLGAK